MTQNNIEQAGLVTRVAQECRANRPSNYTHGYICGYLDGVVTMEERLKAALSAMPQPVAEQSLQNKDACSEPCVRRLSEDEAVGVMIEPIKRFLEVSRRLAQIDPKPEDLDDHSMILARDAYRALLVAQGGQAVAPEVVALVEAARNVIVWCRKLDLLRVDANRLEQTLQPFSGVKTDDK